MVGEYRATGQQHLGRGLLRHTHNSLYLGVDGYWGWVVVTEPGSGDHCLRSVTAPTLCPAQAGSCWRYRNKERSYVKFPALVVQCTQGGWLDTLDIDILFTIHIDIL